jgi:predicted metal-binding protein
MPKTTKSVQKMAAPVTLAMVFICEKCGKRAGGDAKHASYKLASQLKRRLKHEFGKGAMRIAMTSCMDACPEDRIAITVQPAKTSSAAMFLDADPYDIDASADSLLKIVAQIQ